MRRAAWSSQVRFFVPLVATLLVASCTPSQTPAPATLESPRPPASVAPILVAGIPSPLPSATPTVTDTPAPTATPTRTLTPTVVRGVEDTSVLTNVQLVRVIDGNSIEVSIKDKIYTVRYLGIEAPAGGTSGRDATAKNAQLTAGQALRLEKDVTDTDAQGRLLRYVYTKYVMINAEMVRLGYAQPSVQPPDTRYKDLFQTMLQEAKSAKRGMWGAPAKATTSASATPTRSQ